MNLLVAALAGMAAALLVRPVPRPDGRVRSTLERDPVSREGLLPWLAAAGAALGALALVGGTLGLLAAAAAAPAAGAVVARMEPPSRARRRDRLEADLPHVVDLLSACLAAGLEPGTALAQVADAVDGPIRAELGAVASRLRLGVDPVSVWQVVSRHPQLGPLGRCLGRAAHSGASVAEAMARLAEDLRRESRVRVEGRARRVGVRAAVPLGVCMLPAFVLVGVVPLVVSSLGGLLRL